MTDPSLVTRKLALLVEHVARLKRRHPAEVASLRADVDRIDAIALSVLVVVQESIDVAFHIASDEGWGLAATYRESFDLRARHGVITAELASQLGGAVRLRNRIAHGYGSVDVDTLWSDLPAGIAAFEAFAAAVSAFVRRSPA
jgi:uncharacterized protein YutE (UPF0331/DUF86 family)